MPLAQKKAVDSYRKRQRGLGLLRLEVQTPEADAPLLRELARLLRENSQGASEVRQMLRQVLIPEAQEGRLKQLLEAAPLEGVDLSRPRESSARSVRGSKG